MYDSLKDFEIAATLIEILFYIINPIELNAYSPEIIFSLLQVESNDFWL